MKYFAFLLLFVSQLAWSGWSRTTSRTYYSRPRTIHRETTIIHEHHDSGSGLVTGMIVGSMLAQPRQPQVVVVGGAQAPVEVAAPAPVVVQAPAPAAPQDPSHWIFWTLLLAAGAGLYFYKKK